MPPKKPAKAAPVAAKEAPPGDEYDVMNEGQLKEEIRKANAGLAEMRSARNYYLQERDAVQQYFDNLHEEVVKFQSLIRKMEFDTQKAQEAHQQDVKAYMQKITHMSFEHEQNTLAIGAAVAADHSEEEKLHESRKRDMLKQKSDLKEQLTAEEKRREDELRLAKSNADQSLDTVRKEYQVTYARLKAKYEQRLEELRADLDLRQKMEIHEIEERKNKHINELMRRHEAAFSDMRNYYNVITADNFALIKGLNKTIEELKATHVENVKLVDDLKEKNKHLEVPLVEARTEVEEKQVKLRNYEKDKASLKEARSRLLVLKDSIKQQEAEKAALRQTCAALEAERDELLQTFDDTIAAVQQRANMKNDALERVLDDYKEIFEVKRAQFASVLRASNLDPVVLQNVTQKLDDVLTAKNDQIKQLTYETAKIQKAHNDLVRTMEARLAEMNFPPEQLRVEPLLGMTATTPAGLIVP